MKNRPQRGIAESSGNAKLDKNRRHGYVSLTELDGRGYSRRWYPGGDRKMGIGKGEPGAIRKRSLIQNYGRNARRYNSVGVLNCTPSTSGWIESANKLGQVGQKPGSRAPPALLTTRAKKSELKDAGGRE